MLTKHYPHDHTTGHNSQYKTKEDIIQNNKKKLGQFYTVGNPFTNTVFKHWLNTAKANSNNKTILEPFAGAGSIMNLVDGRFVGYDVDPQLDTITKRDTLSNFPKGYDICVTNPPYLSRTSATMKGIKWKYPNSDNLFKTAITTMLDNSKYVAAIVPTSIIHSTMDLSRLQHYISINYEIFSDTVIPVCLVLFGPEETPDFELWDLIDETNIALVGSNNKLITTRNDLLKPIQHNVIKFNDPKGKYGAYTLSNTNKKIEFVKGSKIKASTVTPKGRNIVRFSLSKDIPLSVLNTKLQKVITNELSHYLCAFMGLKKDGHYRRRLDFKTIRQIVHSCNTEVNDEKKK